MSASLLVSCVGVATRPGLCLIAKETASAAPTLCTESGPNGWMDEASRLHSRLQSFNYSFMDGLCLSFLGHLEQQKFQLLVI